MDELMKTDHIFSTFLGQLSHKSLELMILIINELSKKINLHSYRFNKSSQWQGVNQQIQVKVFKRSELRTMGKVAWARV